MESIFIGEKSDYQSLMQVLKEDMRKNGTCILNKWESVRECTDAICMQCIMKNIKYIEPLRVKEVVKKVVSEELKALGEMPESLMECMSYLRKYREKISKDRENMLILENLIWEDVTNQVISDVTLENISRISFIANDLASESYRYEAILGKMRQLLNLKKVNNIEESGNNIS